MVSKMNNDIKLGVQNSVSKDKAQNQQLSISKIDVNLTSPPKSRLFIYIIFGLVIVLALLLIYFHKPNTSAYSTTIPSPSSYTTTMPVASTTIAPIIKNNTLYLNKLSAISGFMNTFNITIPHNNFYYLVPPQFISIPECNFSGYVKWYIENGFSSNPNIPENYSNLNQSIPFAYYYLIGFSNTSSIYSNAIAQNGGYCSDLSRNLSLNSTFIHYNATFYNNMKGYVLAFTNFTAQGFNMTDSYYIGKKPDIAFYYTTVLYNNTRFTVGVWGFRNQINISSVEEMTNSLLKAYIG